MKNTNQRVFYISDNNVKSKPNKVELPKNNDLVVDGQKFIDFQEPMDKPVNPLNGQSNSNFFKHFEEQDLIEFPEDSIPNRLNSDLGNQNNISRQPNLFYDNVKSKYFNNLNLPFQHRNENLNPHNTLSKPTINLTQQYPPSITEDREMSKKQMNEYSKHSNTLTKTTDSRQSSNLYEGNFCDFNNVKSNNQHKYLNLDPVLTYSREDIKSKQITQLKDNLKNNLTSVQTNTSERLGVKTKTSIKREESPLMGNEYIINNTNNDLEFLNTLLKLKPSMEDNFAGVKNDESRSYTREIIGIDNREVTPGRECGDLFFNENISLISHNKSASYLLNNISHYQGESIQNTKHLNKHASYVANQVYSNRSNNQVENNTPVHNSKTTKLNKNDLIEITNKRRNLINNHDISSVEGHFRRRHNEAQARIEKLKKEKIEKENSEIKAHPAINKKSKELVEKLMIKQRSNNHIALSKERPKNPQNLSGNNVSNNVKIFNYNYDPNDYIPEYNNNHVELDNQKNYVGNKYLPDKSKHVNNINLYIGRSLLPSSLKNLKFVKEDSKRRNRSTENLIKANTNSINEIMRQEDYVIETNRIQILHEEKNRPKIEDYDKLVMLSELVNLGTKSKKNTEKVMPGHYKDNHLNVIDQGNKMSIANHYGNLEKEFAFSYDSNRLHNNLQIINQIDDVNPKVFNHCEIDLFDDNQNDEVEENRCVQYQINNHNKNSYNLKESGCSNIGNSNQLYPVLDRNLDFKIENCESKEIPSAKNLYDPNETNELNPNFIDKNKTITNKSNFNQIKYDEQISSNFSMNFSKFSHFPNHQKNINSNNLENVNKTLKHQISANNLNEMTNKNMVNSYISNQYQHDNNTKNNEFSCMTTRKEEKIIHNNYRNNKDHVIEYNNEVECREENNLQENRDKNIYAAEINLFDDQEEIKIEENDNENNEDNYENKYHNQNKIKEVKEKMNYFETENDVYDYANNDKKSNNSNIHEDNYLDNKLEEKDLVIRNQDYLLQEDKLLKKSLINKRNDDLIIPGYLNKIVGEKMKKSLNITDVNSSSLLKSTSTLKISQLKSENKHKLSKSLNKAFKRVSSVGYISPQKRSDSLPEEAANKTRNVNWKNSVNPEKSTPSQMYKSSVNSIKTEGKIQKATKTVNIKQITNNMDKAKKSSTKLTTAKQEKKGSNSKLKVVKTTNNNVKKNNTKNIAVNKSKFMGNNKNLIQHPLKENETKIIKEEENGELEENSEETNNFKNENEAEMVIEKEKEKSKERYNFINLNNDTNLIPGKNKITSIKYEYNEILNFHRQKQKQSVAEIQKKMEHIIKTQEHVENTIKQDFINMNIDESSIMTDSNAFRRECDEK